MLCGTRNGRIPCHAHRAEGLALFWARLRGFMMKRNNGALSGYSDADLEAELRRRRAKTADPDGDAARRNLGGLPWF